MRLSAYHSAGVTGILVFTSYLVLIWGYKTIRLRLVRPSGARGLRLEAYCEQA